MLTHHSDDCPARLGRPCSCGPLGYRTCSDEPLHREPVLGPVRPTVEEARAWRQDRQAAIPESDPIAARPGVSVAAVVDEFLEAARAGEAVDPHGAPYDHDELRDLCWSLRGYVATEFGDVGVAHLNGAELRAFIGRLSADGLSQSRTRAIVRSLRALLRYAAQRGLVAWNATDALVLGATDEPPQSRPPHVATTPAPPTIFPPIVGRLVHDGTTYVHGTGSTRGSDVLHPPEVAQDGCELALRAAAGPSPRTAICLVPGEATWLCLKVVTLAFALIALVLIAEAV
jgi:hypothetical protein